MNFKRKSQVLSGFNAAPMNDIIFFLLLFFLLTSSFAIPTYLKLNLAKANGENVLTNSTVLEITLTGDNKIIFGKDEISEADLPLKLEELLKASESPVINLRGDINSKFGTAVTVMNLANRYKAKMIVAAQK